MTDQRFLKLLEILYQGAMLIGKGIHKLIEEIKEESKTTNSH